MRERASTLLIPGHSSARAHRLIHVLKNICHRLELLAALGATDRSRFPPIGSCLGHVNDEVEKVVTKYIGRSRDDILRRKVMYLLGNLKQGHILSP